MGTWYTEGNHKEDEDTIMRNQIAIPQIEDMNQFFTIRQLNYRDMKYQLSLYINEQLVALERDKLVAAIQAFKLSPIQQYLDIRTLEDENVRHIYGFLRYMDTYLIEMSGGKPSVLRELGEYLLDRRLTAHSSRLLRLEIIYGFFQTLK